MASSYYHGRPTLRTRVDKVYRERGCDRKSERVIRRNSSEALAIMEKVSFWNSSLSTKGDHLVVGSKKK